MRSPDLIPLPALKTYLEQYATQDPKRPHLWTVHTDLPAFKKLACIQRYRKVDVICNLIIPKGATIRARNDWRHGAKHPRKCRATEAVVHSMFTQLKGQQRVSTAYSRNASWMAYRDGQTVRPRWKFDMRDIACTSGIHFFLELRRAVRFPR